MKKVKEGISYFKKYFFNKSILFLSALIINNTVVFSQDVVNPDRIEKEYFSVGKISSETPFIDNKKNGVEKHYYYNGRIEIEIPYINNKVSGIQREYYENGKLKKETSYVNDVIHGIEKAYDKKGNLFSATVYYRNDDVGSISPAELKK